MTLEAHIKQVEGTDKGDILLYALSTCGWCRRTKAVLDELGVKYGFIQVDLLQGEDRKEALTELGKWNPSRSFPTLVIGDKSIIGFKDNQIRETLGG